MENKVFDKTEQFIEDALQKNAVAIELAEQKIISNTADKVKAEKKAAAAFDKVNEGEYHKAQEAARKAKDVLSMYEKRLSILKEEPMITQSEYESKVSDVMAELAKTVSDHKEKVVALVDQIAAIADEDAEIIKRGNTILKKLQHDLYRDQDCTRIRNGNKEIDSSQVKKFGDQDVSGLADAVVNDPRYKKFGGTKKPTGNGGVWNATNIDIAMAQRMQNVKYNPR